MHLNGCAPADLLRQYFSGKLAAFSQASQSASNTSGSDGDEEEPAEAMDIGSGPQPAASVMGQQWADHLPQVLTFLKQLGLQVSLLCIACPSVLPLVLDASMRHIRSSSACCFIVTLFAKGSLTGNGKTLHIAAAMHGGHALLCLWRSITCCTQNHSNTVWCSQWLCMLCLCH